MDYRELPVRDDLRAFVKTCWTLTYSDAHRVRKRQTAMPDGCVEIIRRINGWSAFGERQPRTFAVGLIRQPAEFVASGDAAFWGVRLWPWAWRFLSDRPLDGFVDTWIDAGSPRIEAVFRHFDDDRMRTRAVQGWFSRHDPGVSRIGGLIPGCRSVDELRRHAGLSAKQLQRWFARHVGLAPRQYLRLLRFQEAFSAAPTTRNISGLAADHGYFDHPHLARDFRAIGGCTADEARKQGRGPFMG